uniref:Rab3 GTPase-activating protein catalytic subunit n=1 Tax=Gongylonema pulchrum TaxID=637853 RepID=A0A183D9N1_9BILA
LDICMCYMFSYIARAHNQEFSVETDTQWLPAICQRKNLFGELLNVFEENLLMAHNLKNVSFLWFYLCSLDVGFASGLFSMGPCVMKMMVDCED